MPPLADDIPQGECPPTMADLNAAVNAQLPSEQSDQDVAEGDGAIATVTQNLRDASLNLTGATPLLTGSAQPGLMRRVARDLLSPQDRRKVGFQNPGGLAAERALLRRVGVTSANPVYYGLTGKGHNGEAMQAIFLKPVPADPVTALRNFNSGQLDAQITTILRDLALPGLKFPAAYLVELDTALSYTNTNVLPRSRTALVTVNAAEDGKELAPLRSLLTPVGEGFVRSFQGLTLPDPIRASLLAALQQDALIRLLIGDIDGHAGQYLVQYSAQDGTITEATLVSIDRGNAGGALNNTRLDPKAHHYQRLHLLESAATFIDLDKRRIPMPTELSPSFLATLATLKDRLAAVKIDPSGGSPDLEAAFQQHVQVQSDLINQRYTPTSSDGQGVTGAAADERSDSPDTPDSSDAKSAPASDADSGRSDAQRAKGAR